MWKNERGYEEEELLEGLKQGIVDRDICFIVMDFDRVEIIWHCVIDLIRPLGPLVDMINNMLFFSALGEYTYWLFLFVFLCSLISFS